jgi:hypothetical protein
METILFIFLCFFLLLAFLGVVALIKIANTLDGIEQSIDLWRKKK